MTYNREEMKWLNNFKSGRNHEGKRMPYKDLEDWEKWFISQNVQLHRNYKRRKDNEFPMDPVNFDFIEGS